MRQRVIMVRPGMVGAGGLVLLLLAGCGGTGGTSSTDRLSDVTPAPTASTATPSTGGAAPAAPTEGIEGATGRVLLRAYQGWWDAQAAAFGQPGADTSSLRSYSAELALGGALSTVQQLREAKLVMVGRPRNSPVVTSIRLTADPQSATVEDCLDVTDWHQADATTKELRDPQQRLTRYVATAELRKSDSRWLIVDFKREVGRSC